MVKNTNKKKEKTKDRVRSQNSTRRLNRYMKRRN